MRVGRRSPALDAWLAAAGAREGVFLTAWNPRGRRHPHGWNERREAALDAWLRRWPSRPAWSGAGRWGEAMRLVAMPAARAATLARRFRQAAMLAVRRSGPARLVWCAG